MKYEMLPKRSLVFWELLSCLLFGGLIALAWILRCPGMIAIPKAGSVTHVQENYRSLSIRLTAEDVALLDGAFPPPDRKVHLDSW